MKVVMSLAMTVSLTVSCLIPAFGSDLSSEQQAYCNNLKSKWKTSCNSIKKVKHSSNRTRKIAIGCEGTGLGCGGNISNFNRLNNERCLQRSEDISFNETWSYSTKSGSNKIYWLNGKFIYEAVSKPQFFSGFSMGKSDFTESMGFGRSWFECEMKGR